MYPGQYAQVDPATRKWFQDQKVPGSEVPCCSLADGTYAEEDFHDNAYYVKFRWHVDYGNEQHDFDTPNWVEVPDKAVIKGPNHQGAPVIWYQWQPDTATFEGFSVKIRCFIPYEGG